MPLEASSDPQELVLKFRPTPSFTTESIAKSMPCVEQRTCIVDVLRDDNSLTSGAKTLAAKIALAEDLSLRSGEPQSDEIRQELDNYMTIKHLQGSIIPYCYGAFTATIPPGWKFLLPVTVYDYTDPFKPQRYEDDEDGDEDDESAEIDECQKCEEVTILLTEHLGGIVRPADRCVLTS